MRAGPSAEAELTTQALHGQTLAVYEERDGFAHARMAFDGYVGWVALDKLAPPASGPVRRVKALRSFAFSRPDLKSKPLKSMSLNSLVVHGQAEGRFVACETGGWMVADHLAAPDKVEDDPAAVALRFRGAPYLWGGKESLGLDCTGLTQMAFAACGVTLPRDSDMQFAWAGAEIGDWDRPGALQRSDIVFWKGHCGIMLDSETLLHANAHHMACEMEPLAGAIERIEVLYGRPIGARRIDVAADRGRRPVWLA
ncbi:MAG: NlpC/P60 family protein [Pseudomonadota bacterium]